MSVLRFFAVLLIFAMVCVAWMILGGTVLYRTHSLDQSFTQELNGLWGPQTLVQQGPYWCQAGQSEPSRVPPTSSKITADIRHDFRYKGLLWFSTFTVDFSGTYTVGPVGKAADGRTTRGAVSTATAASASAPANGEFIFPLPRNVTGYDNLTVLVDGVAWAISQQQLSDGQIVIPLGSDKRREVTIKYTTFGREVWLYCPSEPPRIDYDEDRTPTLTGQQSLTKLDDFDLTVRTNFADIDYPTGSRSPSAPATYEGAGRKATWQYNSAMTNQAMGLTMPRKLQAGPITARMSFFAPVSLFFFLTVLFVVVVLKKIPLHPMHYLLIAAAFFAFHILLSYLVDTLSLQAAFWISAVVSMLLVVSYMRLVAGVRVALLYVGLAQLVYLVGFSYAFFWAGKTGLTVTVVAILTLFILMQATGRLNWHEVFRGRNRPEPGEIKQPQPPISVPPELPSKIQPH